MVLGPRPHERGPILEHRGKEHLVDPEAVGRAPRVTVYAEPAGTTDCRLDPLLKVSYKVDALCRDQEAKVGVGVRSRDLVVVDKQQREVRSGRDHSTLCRVKKDGIVPTPLLDYSQLLWQVGLGVDDDDTVVCIEEADWGAGRSSIDQVEQIVDEEVKEPRRQRGSLQDPTGAHKPRRHLPVDQDPGPQVDEHEALDQATQGWRAPSRGQLGVEPLVIDDIER
jgi:hypothetical protein